MKAASSRVSTAHHPNPRSSKRRRLFGGQRRREVLHHLGVGVEVGEGGQVGVRPPPEVEAFRPELRAGGHADRR